MSDERLSWQDNVKVSRVATIARAEANTTPPNVVQVGERIDWSTIAGWTSANFSIHEDDFEITPTDSDAMEVRPLEYPLKVAEFADRIPQLWDRISIPSYETGKKVYEWATNVKIEGQKITPKKSPTRMAFIIEIHGLCFFYMPSVEIYTPVTNMGKRSFVRQSVIINIFATEDVPTGSYRKEFTSDYS